MRSSKDYSVSPGSRPSGTPAGESRLRRSAARGAGRGPRCPGRNIHRPEGDNKHLKRGKLNFRDY